MPKLFKISCKRGGRGTLRSWPEYHVVKSMQTRRAIGRSRVETRCRKFIWPFVSQHSHLDPGQQRILLLLQSTKVKFHRAWIIISDHLRIGYISQQLRTEAITTTMCLFYGAVQILEGQTSGWHPWINILKSREGISVACAFLWRRWRGQTSCRHPRSDLLQSRASTGVACAILSRRWRVQNVSSRWCAASLSYTCTDVVPEPVMTWRET